MKSSFRYTVGGIAATALSLLVAPVWAGTWVKAESQHFVVYSDNSRKVTQRYVQQLEYFRSLTDLLLDNGDEGEEEQPFVIYLLQKSQDLGLIRKGFGGNGVAGVYFNCKDGVQAYGTIYKSDPSNEVRGQDGSQLILFHEYSHHVMYHYEEQLYPPWYVEGFADYLATTTFADGKVVLGQVNGWRASSINSATDGNYGMNDQIDYADLLTPHPTGPDGKPKDINIYGFYAQSWLLTHYMLSDPDRNAALRQYFRRYEAGEDPLVAWETATGIKIKDLNGILTKYSAKMPYREFTTNSFPNADITFTDLSDKWGEYLLTGSALTTCPTDKYGKTLLNRLEEHADRLASDDDFALILTRARVYFGDPVTAEPWLLGRVKADPDDFQATHLLGRLYLAQANKAEGDARMKLMGRARGWFGKAYALNPDDPPNLYYLANSMATLPGFPDINAMNAAESAHAGARSVYDYAEYLAWLYLLRNERLQAQAVLLPFTSDAHDSKRAQRIREAVDAIRANKTTDDVMAILHRQDEDKKDDD